MYQPPKCLGARPKLSRKKSYRTIGEDEDHTLRQGPIFVGKGILRASAKTTMTSKSAIPTAPACRFSKNLSENEEKAMYIVVPQIGPSAQPSASG